MRASQPTPTAPAARSLADIPVNDLPIETSIGTLGLFARDGDTIHLRAGGRTIPKTRFGTVRVNRIDLEITARYRRTQHGTWEPFDDAHGIAFRAGTAAWPTRAAYQTVRAALLAAVTAWAQANPLVLAAAQHTAYQHAIADEQDRIRQLHAEVDDHDRRTAELELGRDAHAAQWASVLAESPAAPATVGSVVTGDGAAHYIVWVNGQDVSWGVIEGLGSPPGPPVLDAVWEHLAEHEPGTLPQVPTWRQADYVDASPFDLPDPAAEAAQKVGDAIGRRLAVAKQPAILATVAQQWTHSSLARADLADEQPPLADALEVLANPDTIRQAGHAEVLAALVGHATASLEDLHAASGRNVPPNPDVKQTCHLIRQHLKQRSGRAWSVTHGRGTGVGWITIHALPSRRQDGHMTQTDQDELARLLDLRAVQPQMGVTVAASTGHRREYIARAMGLTPPVYGTQYWD